LLLLPIPLVIMCAGTMGMVWLLATTQVFLRDTRFIMSFVINIAYFVTPIFYPPELVPERFRWLINFNPFYILVAPFRACIYDFSMKGFIASLGPALIFTVLALGGAAYFWGRKRDEVYFYL
jgi:ABC-type polysaccharide/polyol phosphate export permease